MGLISKLKDYIYGDDDYYFDDDEIIDYEREILGEVSNVVKKVNMDNSNFDKERITEEERKHCLKLYQIACGFNKYDAATVMCVLCQTYPDMVMSAIASEWSDMRETLDKYKEVTK